MTRSFDPLEGTAILERTPKILRVWLEGLPATWTHANEGPETWSAFDVLGHLIHGEKTDWIPRAEHILAGEGDIPFQPFDRFAQFEASREKTVEDLLEEFQRLREENVRRLRDMKLTGEKLRLEGIHPEFGRVALGQHLATWVAHDLSHLAQIARVMAFQWTDAVGPWRKYLRILNP